jgi:hypothetical protein
MSTLLGIEWIRGVAPTGLNDWVDITDYAADPGDTAGSRTAAAANPFYALEHPDTPSSGTFAPGSMVGNKTPLNAGLQTSGAGLGRPIYYVTWDSESTVRDEDIPAASGNQNIWARLRVRCVYRDSRDNAWRGFTVQTYRFANPD